MYKIINRKKLVVTAVADTLGKAMSLPWRMFQGDVSIAPDKIKSILVIRTAYMGDVIMTLPMLKPLKGQFNNASITFLAPNAAGELFANNPYVDEVMTYSPFWFYKGSSISDYFRFLGGLRAKSFDLVIEARADIRDIMAIVAPARSKHKVSYDVGGGGWMLTHVTPYAGLKHKVEYHLDIARDLGCSMDGLDWGIRFTGQERQRVNAILENRGVSKPFALVHPGSRLPLKMWAPEKYGELIGRMTAELGMRVAVLGHPAEKMATEITLASAKGAAIDLSGAFSARELMGVIAEASGLVCNDSAPMHMASAVGTKVAALFGPSKSVETGPYGVKSKVVERDFPCRFTCDENRCLFARHNACMKDITVEETFAAVRELVEA
ncbi:MAG: glycosyltransferase family 9 protein [Nitrospinae bacterium]|nr:glycosyltransferase family 9 protein [Nitrospinota bacterium]